MIYFFTFGLFSIETHLSGTILSVIGEGNITYDNIRTKGDYKQYTEIIIEDGPEFILDKAFKGMSSLQHVHFSKTIKALEGRPFYQNYYLQLFTLDNESQYLWTDGSVLYNINKTEIYKVINRVQELILPSTLKHIHRGCFTQTRVSKPVIIPSSVCQIDTYSFVDSKFESSVKFEANSSLEVLQVEVFYASSISELHISPSIKSIQDKAFSYFVTTKLVFDDIEHSQLTSISKEAFISSKLGDCEVRLPPGIRAIPSSCFQSSNLASVNIPRNCSSIADDAFQGCTRLASVSVDRGSEFYKSIDNVIYNINETEIIFVAPSISSFNISANVAKVSTSLIQGLVNVTKIDVDKDNPHYSGYKGCLYDKNYTVLIGVCGGVKTLELHNSTKKIDDFACMGVNVSFINFSDALEEISTSAFENCQCLTEVEFPSSLRTLGKRSFYQDRSLREFSFRGKSSLETFSDSCFSETGLVRIFVPNSTKTLHYFSFYSTESLSNIEVENESTLKSILNYAFSHAGNPSNPPEFTIPRSVKRIDIAAFSECKFKISFQEAMMESIGENSFYNCDLITGALQLPKTLSELGLNSFAECSQITEISFESGINLTKITASSFRNMNALQKISLPPSLLEFDPSVIFGCFRLTEIEGPYKRTANITVEENIVYDRDGLTIIACPPGLSSVSIEKGITTIGSNAFYNCQLLENVFFNQPSKLTSLSENTFAKCDRLSAITLPSSIQTVGKNCFSSCASLTSVVFSSISLLESVGPSAFADCPLLNNVDFGKSVSITRIGSSAFRGCVELKEVSVPPSVQAVESFAFSGTGIESVKLMNVEYGESIYSDCVNLSKAVVFATTNITSKMFSGCSKLSEVVIEAPNPKESLIKYIGDESFAGIPIVRLTIPFGVFEIGSGVFSNCRNLSEINISSSVGSIGPRCFEGCPELSTIILCADHAESGNCGLTQSTVIYVQSGFEGNEFCGIGINKLLSASCDFPPTGTLLFTSDTKKVTSLFSLGHVLVSEEKCKGDA